MFIGPPSEGNGLKRLLAALKEPGCNPAFFAYGSSGAVVPNFMCLALGGPGRNRPALSDDRGQHNGPVRHSQEVVEKRRLEVDIAVSRAGRETESCADVHSQMVVENRAESDSSHVFPDYSQQIADRRRIDRIGGSEHAGAGKPPYITHNSQYDL